MAPSRPICCFLQELQRHLRREFSKLVGLLQAYALVSTGVRITCSNQASFPIFCTGSSVLAKQGTFLTPVATTL